MMLAFTWVGINQSIWHKRADTLDFPTMAMSILPLVTNGEKKWQTKKSGVLVVQMIHTIGFPDSSRYF